MLKELNDSKYIQNYANGTGLDGRKLMFVKKSDGKVGLVYNPGNVAGATGTSSVTQVLTFVTKTSKFSTATIAVRAKRVPSTILGLASDATRGVTKGQTLTVKSGKIRFQDQYGNNMSASEVKASAEATKSYKIKVTLADTNNFTLVGTGITNITGGDDDIIKLTAQNVAKSGTTKVKLELYYNDTATATVANDDKVKSSEDKTVEMSVALLEDMSNFAIEDPGLRPAKNLDVPAAKGFEPSVIGYYNGDKISLAKTQDFTVYGATTADPTFAPVPEIDSSIKKTVVEKTKVRVIIADNNGTTVEREFSYSNEARKVNKVEMGNTTITVADGTDKAWNDIKGSFEIKDQYDAAIDIAPYITYSDYDTDKVVVSDNGVTTAKIKVKTTNTEAALTVKFTFPGSSYVFEKVITLKRGNV